MIGIHFLQILGLVLLIEIFINTFIFNVIQVRGDSMYPTLEEGDMLLLKKWKVFFKIEKYTRGDIVVFKSPFVGEKTHFVKRIIGVPGDRVNIKDGKIHINNEEIHEPYIEETAYTEALFYGSDFKVPRDQVFVMGDNRLPNESTDSRLFNSIPIKSIEGKISFRFSSNKKIERDL